MYALEHTAGAPEMIVKRNYNLDRTKDVAGTDIAALGTEILYFVSENFYVPESPTYLKTKWKQIEVKDTITIASNMDNTPTDSDQRIGPTFAQHLRWTVGINNVITDPGFMALLMPNKERQTNASGTAIATPTDRDREDQGYSSDTFFGEEIEGISIFIQGR